MMSQKEYDEWLAARIESERSQNAIDAWLLTIGAVGSMMFFAWLFFREGTI